MSNHQELMIVKGVAPAIGDTNSAEQGLTSISLLVEEGIPGWSLDSDDGWNHLFATLKSGGLWADSAISPGRTLIAGQDANVIETMNITVTGSTIPDLAARLASMGRMARDAVDFWTEQQIEPVFIRWWAAGAPGPQFALIYRIELALTEPDIWQSPIRDGTLVIEREPYWRALPPGANPILWTFEANNQTPNEATLNLVGGNNHIVSQTIKNTREWNSTQTAVVSQNYVDIPAESIPGDAPALTCITMKDDGGSPDAAEVLLIGRSTKKTSLPLQAGGSIETVYTLNAGDATMLIADTTKVADAASAPASNSSATGVRTTTTFATSAAMTYRIRWDSVSLTPINFTNLRGQFSVFIRCRLSAAATVNMRWEINQAIFGPTNQLTTVVASPLWSTVYLGQVTLPPENRRAKVSALGIGLKTLPDVDFGIQAERTAGAGQLQIADVFLLPTDECSMAVDNETLFGIYTAIIDNTGYLNHGMTGSLGEVTRAEFDMNSVFSVVSLAGQDILLMPGVNNRLFFYLYSKIPTSQSYLLPSGRSMVVRINIIPRWRGIRDT